MYQPAQLDSFIRLLVCHLGEVVTQADQLIESHSDIGRMDFLQIAIEVDNNHTTLKEAILQQHANEELFALQLSQAREWVDRLGQLDPLVERDTDEFLAATFPIEKLLRDRAARKSTYNLENIMTPSQKKTGLRGELSDHIDVEVMMCAIFEFLGRLEDQYDLVEELFEQKQIVNGVPFGRIHQGNRSAKIIPIFGASANRIEQDNDSN